MCSTRTSLCAHSPAPHYRASVSAVATVCDPSQFPSATSSHYSSTGSSTTGCSRTACSYSTNQAKCAGCRSVSSSSTTRPCSSNSTSANSKMSFYNTSCCCALSSACSSSIALSTCPTVGTSVAYYRCGNSGALDDPAVLGTSSPSGFSATRANSS